MINLSLKYYRAMQKYIRKIEKSKKKIIYRKQMKIKNQFIFSEGLWRTFKEDLKL